MNVPARPRSSSGLPAFVALTRREVLRFLRAPSRIVAALGTGALVWAFFAAGFAESLSPAVAGERAGGYALFLLPGMAALVAMFSAIFSAMSLIRDRNEGFLQSAIASPAPAWAIMSSKIAGGAILATAQAGLVLLAAPLVGAGLDLGALLLAAIGVAVTAGAVTSLGLGAAWWINSSEGFHGIMNLVLMPMWLLSGAFFPAAQAHPVLAGAMAANPMRWCVDAIRSAISPGAVEHAGWAWTGAAVFLVAASAFAWATMGRALGGGPRRIVA